MSVLIRPSQLNSYLQCSAKYRFQYIENIQTPKALALAFGTSVHSAFEKNFSQKVESRADLPTEEVVQEFSDVFDKERENVEKKDLIEDPQAKDVGIGLVTKYHQEFAPLMQPKAVEVKVEATFKGYDYGVCGTMDNLTENKENPTEDVDLNDYKTASRKDAEVPMSHQRQGSLYVLMGKAVEDTVGKIKNVNFDYLLKKKTPEIIRRTFTPDPIHALNMLQRVGEAIEKGVFIPNRDSFMCTRRFCSYWQNCEQTYKGKVKE